MAVKNSVVARMILMMMRRRAVWWSRGKRWTLSFSLLLWGWGLLLFRSTVVDASSAVVAPVETVSVSVSVGEQVKLTVSSAFVRVGVMTSEEWYHKTMMNMSPDIVVIVIIIL